MDLGAELNLLWVLPFVGILLSIGLFPLFAPNFWHHHFQKIAAGFAVLFAVPFLAAYGWDAVHEILHIYVVDYIPFVILLWSLFTISGGIVVHGDLRGTPATNLGLILAGTAVASWIGTTGASMLLIRPLLKANAKRVRKVHTVVFFIFLVSNVGGSLTPLGDPPLFLGFLHSVPFFWTLTNLWQPALFSVVVLAAVYFLLDSYHAKRESPEALAPAADPRPLSLEGTYNFLLLGGVVAGVLLSGSWDAKGDLTVGPLVVDDGDIVLMEEIPHETRHAEGKATAADRAAVADEGIEGVGPLRADPDNPGETEDHRVKLSLQNLARDLILVAMGLISLYVTPRRLREENGFSWFPIVEVAWLFAGIFMTIIPALAILQAGERGAMGFLIANVQTTTHYFWVTGLLSSFLDNAPTYLTFFNTALGQFGFEGPEKQQVTQLIAEQNGYLVSISLGAVFMGANSYIGNAPNFMVRSIAEEADVPMPDFFSYILKYSVVYLIPLFVVVNWLFL